jgi:hypothetical protein
MLKINKMLTSLTIHPRKIIQAITAMPWYFNSLKKFKSNTTWSVSLYPCLLDRYESGGSHGEYFWQDLEIAKQIIFLNPERHIDVGSRLDGFIAHLACVRHVEVLDIRPINASIENVRFHQVDVMQLPKEWEGIADIVTCLHSLEHFGLGRYNDPLDPDGWQKGFDNLSRIIKQNGTLWVSVPMGKERVEFNAHRVFNPLSLVSRANKNGLQLVEFAYFNGQGFNYSNDVKSDMKRIASMNYCLGFFKFIK